MPWSIEEGHSSCPASRPFAVVKESDGHVEGCHPSAEAAKRQQATLYAQEDGVEQRAEMTAARINDLPDSAFAYIEPGGSKDEQGKTVPRSKRHFPIHDAAHVRNALARAPQSPFGAKAMPKIRAAAKKFGIQLADERRSTSPADVNFGQEIITRSDSVVLSDQVDFRQRLIDVIAVPYDQETEVLVRGEMWREVFDRRAFDGFQDHAGRIPVNREHAVGQTFGKVVKADPFATDGLMTTIRVAKTPLGEETLQLASEDMLGASVGYYVKKPSHLVLDRKTMHRRVMRAFLRHLSLVESPAYAGAAVLSVRDSDERAPGAPVRTPVLDEFVNDDLFRWVNSRLRAE